MGDEILKKLDIFLDNDVSESRVVDKEVKGMRPIQFMRFWKDFRPGDRCDVEITNDYINIVGTNANGNFSGISKEFTIEDENEIEEFKNIRRKIWNFI